MNHFPKTTREMSLQSPTTNQMQQPSPAQSSPSHSPRHHQPIPSNQPTQVQAQAQTAAAAQAPITSQTVSAQLVAQQHQPRNLAQATLVASNVAVFNNSTQSVGGQHQQLPANSSSPVLVNPDTRTHVVGELYDTERSYVESLQVLIEKYMKPLKSVESNRILIDSNLVDEIFYTIPEILKHHETFLSALQHRLSSDWDTSQVIGNVFIEAFTNQQIIDTYTAFINNWKNARQAIKIATQAKPAFERFLEAMSREHRNKLTLDALLIMPVQRIPRYELLIKELIKHTPEDHPDYGPLIEAQKQIHELALKIDRAEREMIHLEQLKDIESLIEGHVELQHPQRDFIRYDLVTIMGASALTVAKKERVIFLFCDLLIMTSVKKKASRRSNLQAAFANSSNDLSLLEGNKFKLLLRVSLDQVEVRLSNDQLQIQQQQQEQQHQLQLQQQNKLYQDRKRELEADLSILNQMNTLSSKMVIDDKSKINYVVNELSSQLREKLFILEQGDIQSVVGAQQSSQHPTQVTSDSTTIQPTNLLSSSVNNGPVSTSTSALASTTITNQLPQIHGFSVSSPTTLLTSGITTGNQLESNTSLEFLISNSPGGNNSNHTGNISKDSSNTFSNQTSNNTDSLSGEQGYVVGCQKAGNTADIQSSHQHNIPQSSNCESLTVTFASFERHQAFLQAFIEAKQQRYQLKQQRQNPRMYSTSTVLRLSGSSDNKAANNDGRKTKLSNQDNIFNGSPSPIHHIKNTLKQQTLSSITTRNSSAPLHQSSACGSTIIHQMSAPQSLSLVSTSSNDIKTSISARCNFCSSNTNLENEQYHHHHHQLIHQPKSHPASLDTICCHDHHNDEARFDSGTGSVKHLSRLNELDYSDQMKGQNHYLDCCQQGESSTVVNLNDEFDKTRSSQNADHQKLQLMSHMNQLLLLKSAPRFALTLPMNFLNTQHPALQFTCSTLRLKHSDEVRNLELSMKRQQTVRDNSGQLWLCMSNGYVSHIALISIRKRLLDRGTDVFNQEECDGFRDSRRCYNIVPIIQSAGDVCKSHINCATQVRLIRREAAVKDIDRLKSTNDQTSSELSESKNSKDEHEHEKTNTGPKTTSPPVSIKPNSPSGKSDLRQFLSESAPSCSDSFTHKDRSNNTVTSSVSTTRLEVPLNFGSIPQMKSSQLTGESEVGKKRATHSTVCRQRQYYDNLKCAQYRTENCAPGTQKLSHHGTHRRSFVTEPHRSGNHHHHHYHHYHHHHHHHHSHHHSHLHHSGHNHHSVSHHHVYGSRHHTVPITELRRALEKQNRLVEPSGSKNHGLSFVRPSDSDGRPVFDLMKNVKSDQKQISSLDLTERMANSMDKKITGKSFRSARLLRHQASLKTSSILAKLVSGASKRSSYLRKPGQGSDKQQSDADDIDTDTDSGNPQQQPHNMRQEDTSSIDSNILAITTPGANKYLLSTSNSDVNNLVISPLSSASSLASTNSSITVNSVCASSPNRSTCDLLSHSLSTTCCNGPISQQRPSTGWDFVPQRDGSLLECGHRSRSATVPSCPLSRKNLDQETRTSYHSVGLQQDDTSCDANNNVARDTYKVSEIIGDSNDKQDETSREVKDSEFNIESSLWLGCDDGSLLIINCLVDFWEMNDCNYCEMNPKNLSCGNVHSEIKLGAAICDICTYNEKMVFVALSNGQLAIFTRQSEGNKDTINEIWDLTNPTILMVTPNELNSTSKLCFVDDKYLWYAYGRNIFVLNVKTLKLETTIMVPTNDPSLQFTIQSITIDDMELMSDSLGVWISFKNSHLIQLYDVAGYKLLLEINLFEPINKMLSYGNEILRQHKTACIKATSLLNINNARENCNTLFIGTSAGIVLYLNITEEQLNSKKTLDATLKDWTPQIASLRHGHSGHVKFLHVIELESDQNCELEHSKENNGDQIKVICNQKETFLVSGGIGVDLYGPDDEQITMHQLNSDADNMNHLLLWQL